MHTNHFKSLVQSTWAYWQQHIDRFPEIDWEETEESMTILLPDRRKYLFNRHTGMQQLWMASPISGGRHFSLRGQENSLACKPHRQDHGQCLHRALIAHTLQDSDDIDKAEHTDASLHSAYWTDTRNGDIVELVLNAEFSSQWDLALHLQPFKTTLTPHSSCERA